MALPAGRVGLRKDLVTYDGQLKEGGGTNITITRVTTPVDDAIESCDFSVVDFGDFYLVSGIFNTVNTSFSSGWKRVAAIPLSADGIRAVGVRGYIVNGKQACDMGIDMEDNGYLRAFLDGNHLDTWFEFTFIYRKGVE